MHNTVRDDDHGTRVPHSRFRSPVSSTTPSFSEATSGNAYELPRKRPARVRRHRRDVAGSDFDAADLEPFRSTGITTTQSVIGGCGAGDLAGGPERVDCR